MQKRLRLFRSYLSTQGALLRYLDRISRRVVTEYNADRRSLPEIENCRIEISKWHPDGKSTDISLQFWLLDSDYVTTSDKSLETHSVLEKIVSKHLPPHRSFDIESYIQNLRCYEDD